MEDFTVWELKSIPTPGVPPHWESESHPSAKWNSRGRIIAWRRLLPLLLHMIDLQFAIMEVEPLPLYSSCKRPPTPVGAACRNAKGLWRTRVQKLAQIHKETGRSIRRAGHLVQNSWCCGPCGKSTPYQPLWERLRDQAHTNLREGRVRPWPAPARSRSLYQSPPRSSQSARAT